ncbi:hypothetical protein GCM10007938_35840 [Vibrio zhanjiangensis]|uniref:Uncharacterized protein n=1 Tax=Vibrio zhanjiangensis TaxID=1046128 RepID=A0ABQ6F4S8_9VIBR|nr:tetratricopeptide repeat protein [Vibrio zhanjiangensis]GLT19801.1 hypothetical protein GCM10007938_35840 [Vibrio zhanjiangensis]
MFVEENSPNIVTVRRLLVLFLEQQQWRRAKWAAIWLEERGDLAARIVLVDLLVKLEQYTEALETLTRLPISIRKMAKVRRIEARAVFSLGHNALAKKIYLFSLDKEPNIV